MQATPPTTQAPPDPTETPSASALARELYCFVVYLHKSASSDLFRAVAELELSTSQIKTLYVLDRDDIGELTLKDLAERIDLSLPAASRTVECLHQRGWVTRHEDHEDRRMKRVSITEGGRDTIRRMHAAQLSLLEEFAATLTPVQQRRLSAALAPVLAREEVAACRLKLESGKDCR